MAKIEEAGEEIERFYPRYRINVSTSVKGVKTYDCTVDSEAVGVLSLEEALIESDKLVAELDRRYPPVVGA
jgi:hypothetical protein